MASPMCLEEGLLQPYLVQPGCKGQCCSGSHIPFTPKVSSTHSRSHPWGGDLLHAQLAEGPVGLRTSPVLR